MQTFCSEKNLQPDLGFSVKKAHALQVMAEADIEEPIIEVIDSLNKLPCCFTLQSCFGHFLLGNQNSTNSFFLPAHTAESKKVLYRISYVAIRVDNSPESKKLLSSLRKMPSKINKKYIQFGCAEWFWEQHINSYVIQVQPEDRSNVDSLHVSIQEAKLLQTVRNKFWKAMRASLCRF